jgi:hypothetical protein
MNYRSYPRAADLSPIRSRVLDRAVRTSQNALHARFAMFTFFQALG